MEFFHYFRARRFRSLKVCLHVVNENGQALRAVTQFGGAQACPSSTLEHDPRVAQMHLGPADRLAITIVLLETKRLAQPADGLGNVAINNVRQNSIRWHRAILDHCVSSLLGFPGKSGPSDSCLREPHPTKTTRLSASRRRFSDPIHQRRTEENELSLGTCPSVPSKTSAPVEHTKT